ncbi:MAG: M18 family aminopeptidase [Bacilli bacterium]|nr:M18 family aminopeptidase [Bacilli bacterium]
MKGLIDFLNKSVNEYLAVEEIKRILDNAGFEQLEFSQNWNLKNGGNYYVVKDQSSLIAFKMGLKFENRGFNIVASHLDSPCLKIKQNGIISVKNNTILNTEVYGGPILATWFDRPLSIAGRVIVKENEELVSKIVNVDKDLLIIPSAAIHLKKDVTTNPQKDLLPIASLTNYESINVLLEKVLGINKDDIISFDLSVYNKDQAKLVGVNEELLVSPRIDNLECAYTSLQAFINSVNENKVNVYAAFNNEEVGSNTKQGADSTILYDVLRRIVKDEVELNINLANSFLVSADNAHAQHPNYMELSDPTNNVLMNKGIVIKHNSNQRYTTDGVSSAVMQVICEKANVPYQHYTNRSDQRGGGTLGAISSSHVSIHSVDIGLAQLAMHSANETAGSLDAEYMIKALEEFYRSNLNIKDNKISLK